jgi:metal transporter CNNM
LLFVKDLIFIDPEDNTRIQDFVEIFGRALHTVWPDDTLGDVLRELRQGKSHMALVRGVNNEDESKDPFYEIKGIITLEDIIEEIIGAEIVDETDKYVDGTHSEIVDRGETFEWASLRLLDAKIVDETLSFDETRAVTAHLMRNYASVVSLVTENQLNHLISTTPVAVLATAIQEVGQEFPDDTMYKKGEPNDTCTLILSGKVKVIAGADNFRTDVSSWSVLGAGALQDPNYQPDFTAFVRNGPCRCLRLTRAHFSAAVDASTLERQAAASGTPALPLTSAPEYKSDSTGSTGTRKQKLITALQAVNTTESVHPVGRRAVKAASVTRLNLSSHESLPPLEEEQTGALDADVPTNEAAADTTSANESDDEPIE